LTTANMPQHDSQRGHMNSIGWGVQNERIRHDLVNVEKPRFAKPTLKYLDSAKSSNFINFLHSKHNEINH